MITPEYSDANTPDLDITPVFKFNWKDKEFRDYFQEALGEIQDNIGERLIASVESDDHPRRVATYHINSQNIPKLSRNMSERGLAWDTIDEDPGEDLKHGSSNPNIQYFVVGTDYDIVDEYIVASEIDDPVDRHRRQGEILGYPECCINSFIEQAVEGDRKDPKYEAACACPSATAVESNRDVTVENPYPVTNTFWQQQGWSLLDHDPCSFECQASHELGVKNGEIIRELGLDGDILWEWLTTPVTWDAYHGLAHIRNDYAIGEYVTDDNWSKKVVRFGGEHKDRGVLPQ